MPRLRRHRPPSAPIVPASGTQRRCAWSRWQPPDDSKPSHPPAWASAAVRLVAIKLFPFFLRDACRHLRADRASFGERIPGGNSPRTEVTQGCAHRCRCRDDSCVSQAEIGPHCSIRDTLIWLMPDIYRPAADIAYGLLVKKGASIGSLAQRIKLDKRQVGKTDPQGRPV